MIYSLLGSVSSFENYWWGGGGGGGALLHFHLLFCKSVCKEELFSYLSDQLTTIDNMLEGEVVSTEGESVIFNKERHKFDQIAPYWQEEADARLMVHIYDISRQGYKKPMAKMLTPTLLCVHL